MATDRHRYVTKYQQDKLFLVSVTNLRSMTEDNIAAPAVSMLLLRDISNANMG